MSLEEEVGQIMHLGDSRIERVRIRSRLAMLTVRVVDLEYS